MKKVVAYIRVSTDGQTKEDKYGIPEQKAEIQEFCDDNGYEITEWYIEQISGATKERPVFDKILNGTVTNPPIEAVVIARNDRLARDIEIFFGFKFLLRKSKIELISVKEDFGEFGSMFAKILEAFTVMVAEMEREHINQRTSGGRKLKAREGGYSGGRAPFGYKVSNHQLVIEKREAEVVKAVYELRRAGKSMGAIARELNERGFTNRSGGQMSVAIIQKILENEKIYRGLYKYGDMEWVQGKHEPILTTEYKPE